MILFPAQVSESGVHRPHVAGIHGRENEGSYSIVLSGGYDDDKVIIVCAYLYVCVYSSFYFYLGYWQ